MKLLNRLRSKPKLGQNQVSVFSTISADATTKMTETVTYGLWTGDTAELTTYFTSSDQTVSQRRYYTDVYNTNPDVNGSTSAVQFAIAYGHSAGSGSSTLNSNDSPSRAVYSQYARLLLTPGDNQFTIPTSGSTNSIYVINFARNLLRERLAPGTIEIPLRNISARDTNATGSVTVGSTQITLIDDSTTLANDAERGEYGRVFNIVSGSLLNGVYNSSAPHYYGLLYPDYGIAVLDGRILDKKLGGANFSNTGSGVEANNHFALFNSISGSLDTFYATNSETINSTSYFVRVFNNQFNHSTNPTYATGSSGVISEKSFWTDPKAYITTVGLYSPNFELLAIAKLSKPLLKSRTRETTIRVKLDF